MNTLLSLSLVLLFAGCATGARKSSVIKVVKATKAPAVKPVSVEPIPEFFKRLAEKPSGAEVTFAEIPSDYFTNPEALRFIGGLKSKDVEIHRAVALALPRATSELAFAAADAR